MLYERLVHVSESETLTDLQILGCKLHQNAFGGQALPGNPEGSTCIFVQGHGVHSLSHCLRLQEQNSG